MRSRRIVIGAVFGAVTLGLAWLLFVGLPRWYEQPIAPAAESAPAAPADPARRIKAHLFYVAEDGTRLASVEHDVPYADQPVAQARAILDAQLAPAAAPLVSAIPPGTTLRAVFITPRGEAFVDMSRTIASAHPGGSLDELLTIYTIVHALTFNMPAVTSVQLLVDGKEVETLAGHVDLRRPLAKNVEFNVSK